MLWAAQCKGFASPATIVGGPTIVNGAPLVGGADSLRYTRFVENFVTQATGTPEDSSVVANVTVADTPAPPVEPAVTQTVAHFSETELIVDLGVWCGLSPGNPELSVTIPVQPFPTGQPLAPVFAVDNSDHVDLAADVVPAATKRTVRSLAESPNRPSVNADIFLDSVCARSTKHPNAVTLRKELAAKRQAASTEQPPFWLLAYPPTDGRSSVNFNGDHIGVGALVSILTVIVGGSLAFIKLAKAVQLPQADDDPRKALCLQHLINYFTLGLLFGGFSPRHKPQKY